MAINNGINPEDIIGAFAGLPYTLSNKQAQMDPVSAVMSRMGQGPFDGTANRIDDGFPTFEKFQSDMRKQEPPGLPEGATFDRSIDMGLSPGMAAKLAIANSKQGWIKASRKQKQEDLKSPEIRTKSLAAEIINANPELIEMNFNDWDLLPMNSDSSAMLKNSLSSEGISIEQFLKELNEVQSLYKKQVEDEENKEDEEIDLPTSPMPTHIPTSVPNFQRDVIG